jgi:hypothetical protein
MVIRTDRRNDQRRYNVLKMNEVATISRNIYDEQPFERDIRIYSRSENKTQRISILNENCDVLSDSFPHCELGWNEDMNSTKVSSRSRITWIHAKSSWNLDRAKKVR